MRKISLALCMVATATVAFGQPRSQAVHRESKANDRALPAPDKSFARETKDILFFESFDASTWSSAVNDENLAVPANMPAGWEVYDNTGNNYFWHWTALGARGAYTSNPGEFNENTFVKSESNTSNPAERGAMLMEINYHNTNPDWVQVTNPVNADSWLQTPAIDCSGAAGVGVKFAQTHRFCCTAYSESAGPKVQVSTDGTNFTLTEAVQQAAINATPATNPSYYDFSITSVAANQSTVYLRFWLVEMRNYYWMIDDIMVYVPAEYDARFKYHWADWSEHLGALNNDQYIEKLFLGAPYQVAKYAIQQFASSRAHSRSVGLNPLQDLRLRTTFSKIDAEGAASELHSAMSAGIMLAPGYSDTTLMVEHNYTIPAELGKYEIRGELVAAQPDGVPEDNIITNYFNVTENVTGYANPANAHLERASPYSYVGAVDGDGVGVVIGLNPSSTGLYDLQGVNVFITRDGYNYDIWEQGAVAYLEAQLCACLDPASMDFDLENPIISTESTPIDSTAAGAWVYMPFNRDGAAEYLSVNDPNTYYYLNVRFYTNGMGDGGRFYIGADALTQPSYLSNWITVGGDDQEGVAAATSSHAIELVANEFGAVWPTSDLSITMVNTNPESGVVEPARGALLKFFMPDDEGGVDIQEYTYTGQPIVIEGLKDRSYGYRATWNCIVNGVADTTIVVNGSIAVQGGQVDYVVDFKRNSIDNAPVAIPALSIYPNPAGDMVTVNTQNASRIVVSNLLGQTVRVITNPAQRQAISLAGLESGVYIVSVYDQQGNQSAQRLVKE